MEQMTNTLAKQVGSARRRLVNLLARHPDLVQGRLDAVAGVLCREGALALDSDTLGIWQLEGQGLRLVQIASNHPSLTDMEAPSVARTDSPGFFALLERRRVLDGALLDGFGGGLGNSLVASILVNGRLWGLLSINRISPEAWSEGDRDMSALLAEMVGRCIDRRDSRLELDRLRIQSA